jgi:uncharacterized repeat protein (TIGR03806 family)
VKRAVAAIALWVGSLGTSVPAPVDDALITGDTLPQKLSEFRLLAGPFGRTANERVTGYTLNTPLFSDYAEKWRYLYVPIGQKIGWRDDGVLEFPVGSVLVKSFGYPADMRQPTQDIRMLETRLLLRRASGWVALPYVWNEDGSDAVLKRAGTRIPVSWTHTDGSTRSISYAVPNANQCKGCHDLAGTMTPIGPKARNLNDGKQLNALLQAGLLDRLPGMAPAVPVWNDARTGDVNTRARAYLDVNCAHCHNRNGPANTSGLWLDWNQEVGPNLGIGKRPTAAGRGSANLDFAIAPGHPEQSYLISRMQSLDPGIAMPELGRASVHEEGVALLSQWIAEMK